MADTPRGRFVWHDLMTADPEAAKQFYTAVADWGTQKWDGGDPNYTMWTSGQTPIGGLMPLDPQMKQAGVPPHWIAYVSVPNVDATAARAKELGGQVVAEPTDIPTVGRYAVIADPQGATIAIFTPVPGGQEGSDGEPSVGDFSWHELTALDYQKAFAFYSELFGWETTSSMDMGPELGVYHMYGRNGVPLGGMYNKPADMPVPPNWLPYIRVRDINKAAKVVADRGGQILNGPMEVPGGDWILQGMDPQGGMFALHAKKA
jgi:uncharacterized protein